MPQIVLSVVDIKAGDLVCVHTGRQVRTTYQSYEGLQFDFEEDRSLTGIPYEVVAVNLPFLVVHALVGSKTGHNVVLDTREHKLMRVSEAYCGAMAPEWLAKRKAAAEPAAGPQVVQSAFPVKIKSDGGHTLIVAPVGNTFPPQAEQFLVDLCKTPRTLQEVMTSLVRQWREICDCENCTREREQRDERCRGV